VSRLQVGGTDAPVDEPGPDPAVPHLAVLVPPEPTTTLGKAMAQAGHAGMIFAALAGADRPKTLDRWVADGCPVAVRRVDADTWAARLADLADPSRGWADHGLLAVRDAGFTEVDPGTITVIGTWTP
jgi:peptidyl-tRNA hydrolase